MSVAVKRTKTKSLVIVSKKVKDYGNDPFFVKKAKESKTFLEKHGFPKELLTHSSLKGSKDKGVRTLKN